VHIVRKRRENSGGEVLTHLEYTCGQRPGRGGGIKGKEERHEVPYGSFKYSYKRKRGLPDPGVNKEREKAKGFCRWGVKGGRPLIVRP